MGSALLAVLLLPALGLAAYPTSASTSPSAVKYVFSSSRPVTLLDHGVKVVAEDGANIGPVGAGPLMVRVENLGTQPTEVTLRFRKRNDGTAEIRRSVSLVGGARGVVSLPVPTGFGYGSLEAHSPAASSVGQAYVGLSPVNRLLLSVGSESDFEEDSDASPTSSSYSAPHVRTIDPAELPGELSSYTSFDAVVVSAPLDTLPERGLRALESYALTGGTLILEKPTRVPSAYLPLLAADAPPDVPQRYGFGTVVVCDGVAGCLGQVQKALKMKALQPVTPRSGWSMDIMTGPSAFGVRRRRDRFLLPEVTAPTGTFLAIIVLFSLVIGPGSIWVARRWSAMHLLLTIPATALVTCMLIAGTALVKDGFALRAGTRSVTLLDAARHRAVTVGVAGFYANLSPGQARFDDGCALLGQVASVDWTDGARFGDDFIPSRTYREWGLRAVEPTRARLVVRSQGNGLTVENALGAEIRDAWITVNGKTWHVANVPDGGAARATPGSRFFPVVESSGFSERFGSPVLRAIRNRPGEGRFLAKLEGPGLLPLGGLHFKPDHSQALVMGEVSR